VFAALALVAAVALVEAVNLGGEAVLRAGGRIEDEIRWLEALEPVRVWDLGRHVRIATRYRHCAESELRAGRVDRAVQVMRRARARSRARHESMDPALVRIGLEAYTQAADRMERHGRFSIAADWNDTLFVFAVRDPEPRHRAAAAAAFVEGLSLRVRDGKPCAALWRVAWARKGLGGEIPDFDPAIESSLATRCEEQRRLASLGPVAPARGGRR
jgi:hypothetical protein